MRLIDPPTLPMTAEEFANLPEVEGARIELWEGSLFVMAAAQMWWHSAAVHRVVAFFRAAGRAAGHEIGVVVGPRHVPIPDVLVLHDVTPNPDRSQVPADEVACVVEVVSRESVERDTTIKPAKYAAARIPEFWLVTEDPDDHFEAHVEIYRLTPAGTYAVASKWTLAGLEQAGYDARLGG